MSVGMVCTHCPNVRPLSLAQGIIYVRIYVQAMVTGYIIGRVGLGINPALSGRHSARV